MILPVDRLSKKKQRMPMSTSAIVRISSREGFFLKNRNIRRISQIGILYCRTIAFPAVVSLFAIAKSVVTPAIHTAPMKTVKLNFMRWWVKNM